MNLVVANVLWDIPYIKLKCTVHFIAVFAGWRKEVQKNNSKPEEDTR